MPWLGIALLVLAILTVILVLTRPRVTIVAPPESTTPSLATASSTGDASLVGDVEKLLAGKASGMPSWSAEKRVTTTVRRTIRVGPGGPDADPDTEAFLAKMDLPGGLIEQAKESLHRAEEASPRYPDSTLVFGSVTMSRSAVANQARGTEADRSVLACAADPEVVRRWYSDWLTGHGWHAEPATLATGETAADSYARGSEQLRLTIVDRALLSLPQGITAPEGQTMYELRYLAGTQ